MAELESVTGSLETEIDLQTVVKSPEALAVLNLLDVQCPDTFKQRNIVKLARNTIVLL